MICSANGVTQLDGRLEEGKKKSTIVEKEKKNKKGQTLEYL